MRQPTCRMSCKSYAGPNHLYSFTESNDLAAAKYQWKRLLICTALSFWDFRKADASCKGLRKRKLVILPLPRWIYWKISNPKLSGLPVYHGLPLSSSLISLELLRCLLQGIHTFLDCPGGTMQPQNDMVLRAEWFHLISEISLGVVELRWMIHGW